MIVMGRALIIVLRWLLLIPAYLVLCAIWSTSVLSLYSSFQGSWPWHGHVTFVLFFCSVLQSVALCLLSALIAPFFKKLVGVLAVLALIGLNLHSESLVLAGEGLTGPIMVELAADIIGGILGFICLRLICPVLARSVPVSAVMEKR